MKTLPVCLLVGALLSSTCLGQLPGATTSVSGELLDAAGVPVVGSRTLVFRIYDAAVGGVALWAETHLAVPLAPGGRYIVALGSVTPLVPGLFGTPGRWLGIQVQGDAEMTPRLKLGTMPYTHNSSLLEGSPAATFAPRAELRDSDNLTTPVGWLDLFGVPAGFADGVDDVNDADSDPTNELQTWGSLPGVPAGFADGVDDVNDADSDPTNELQTWGSLPGVPAGFADGVDDVNDADSDPTNELQTWGSLPGVPAGFADGVDDVNDADSDPTNELQTWGSLPGVPAGFADGVDDVNDADSNPANELNTSLGLNGTMLEITDAAGTLSVDLAGLAGGGAGQGGGTLAYPDPLSGMTPLTKRNLMTTPYVVPATKAYYITSLFSQSAGNLLSIDGKGAVHGLTNEGQSSGSQTLGQPLLAGPGETVSANTDSMVCNGYLVDSVVATVHLNMLSTSPYVVPPGQNLVILHVLSLSAGQVLQVNGATVVMGTTNEGQSSGSQVLDHPVLATAGDALSSSSNSIVIHGYLSGASLPGAPANPGDLSFPDGLSGIAAVTQGTLFSTPYTPPAGKNLYVTNYRCSSSGAALLVNGLSVFDGNSNFGVATSWNEHLEQPLLLGPADMLSSTSDNPVVNGFLVDDSTIPLTVGTLLSAPYVVPAGQLLVILNYRCSSSGAALLVDGMSVFDGNSSFGVATSWTQRLGLPLLVGEGQAVSSTSDNPVINGYLRLP